MVQFDNVGNARSLTPTRALTPIHAKTGRERGPKNACSLTGFGMTSL